MSDLAETNVQQAEAAIRAGDFTRAMDLFRKARMLAAGDPDLTGRILVQMIQIAPRVGAGDEVHTWRQLLTQLRSIDGMSIPIDVGDPATGASRQPKRAVAGAVAKYGAVLVGVGLLFVSAWWYWGLSASRYRPTTTTSPSSELGGD